MFQLNIKTEYTFTGVEAVIVVIVAGIAYLLNLLLL